MQTQSVYFDERTETKHVQVLKVYDNHFARTCFEQMTSEAITFLANALDLPAEYDLPIDSASVSWTDVETEAREDGNLLSFFVVLGDIDANRIPLYVSPDWPSAEAFAKSCLRAAQ
jgi:hypothetical protein